MSTVDRLRSLPGIYDLKLKGARVLLRLDFNVPMRDGKIHSDARLVASFDAVRSLRNRGARTMILAHLGRPDTERQQAAFSLQPVARWLSARLNQPVPLYRGWLQQPPQVAEGEVVLLENVRFHEGEIQNSDVLGQQLADLCDLFVMDAFAVSHRANASTESVVRHARAVCAGPLLLEEMEAIGRLMDNPQPPVVTIAGGAKISDKLPLLRNLARISDYIIPGGGIANTFLAAKGLEVGTSLHQKDLSIAACDIMNATRVLLPEWVVTAPSPDRDDLTGIQSVESLGPDSCILDIAPRSVLQWKSILDSAGTILWNGPLGLFERPAFAAGTRMLGQLLSRVPGFVLAGGGDTLSAVSMCGIAGQLSYLSTGGGAFLAALEGRTLPAVDALLSRAAMRSGDG